ncbi:MAG: hypothetical protein JWR69_2528 [Pedosphaera sp.]|nr:hypothetical protein [Pedosphaera sp.]
MDLSEAGWNSSGSSPATLLFRNNGTNTFTSITLSSLTNLADGSITWADYDNDGDPELLITGNPNSSLLSGARTWLYRNDNGVFTDSKIMLPAVSKSAVAWADVDNDGDLDLLIAGQTGSTASMAITKLFRNDGHNILTEVPTSLPGVTHCAVAFGDYDNDGKVDILIAGFTVNTNRIARVYHNEGNWVFSDSGVAMTGVSLAAVAWGDYDNDGFADALVSGITNGASSAITKVYHNNGDGTFIDETAALPGISAHSATWGDYDRDGDLDLLLGSQVYRNNWNTSNSPPSPPSGLFAQLRFTNETRLGWAASTDLQTTNSRGLNYNLRLGTTLGGAQIVVPQSDLASGHRRVPLPGNAGSTNFWRISSLTNGIYYWSVQAIDPGFAGSGFATESSFTVSRPLISGLTNRSTPPNSPAGPFAFTVTDAETPASNLLVFVACSDTNLLPAANLVLAGSGTNRTLSITPATNRSGMATITIFATDENGETGASSFLLTVERFKDILAGFPATAGPIAWGDYDNDGSLDLILRNSVYHNNGGGVFVLATNISAPVEGSANWGDFDADGDLDLLVTGSNAARILRNQAGTNFTDIVAGLVAPSSFGASAWGDFDNDGDLDAVVAGSSATRIYRNNGNGTFTDITAGLPAVGNGAVAWGDYDKDGDLDLLLAGSGILRIYRNNGNGTFTDTGAGLPGLYNASVAWGEFNNDGLLDFVACGSTNNTVSGVVTRIYRSFTNANLSLSFTNIYPVAAQGPVGIWKGTVAWGDYDNDGDLDLLVTGESTNTFALTRLYRNDGGLFVDNGFSLPGMSSSFAAWGDFDNDGYLDLALSGYTNGVSAGSLILRNFGAPSVPNSPPAAPGGLISTVNGKSATLKWSGATDQNQTNGFSYNLRVGTAPGLGNVMSPMAAANGLRRLPALGNVNERLAWTITNLLGGTYHWSVQAVDHAFAGSSFSAEQIFIVTNSPPVVANRFITVAEDGSVGIILSATDPDNDPVTYSIVTPPLFGSLSGSLPSLTYRPATNYFGFDQFIFRAGDRTTNSDATAYITVTPVPDMAVAQLGISPIVPDHFQISLKAEPWRTWQIQASVDLVHWEAVTNVLATNILTQLIDADSALYPQRFYRAAQTTIKPEIVQPVQSNGTFGFFLAGELGRNYQLEASTNLTTWIPLENILFTNSSMFWSDPEMNRFKTRFYRIRSLQ